MNRIIAHVALTSTLALLALGCQRAPEVVAEPTPAVAPVSQTTPAQVASTTNERVLAAATRPSAANAKKHAPGRLKTGISVRGDWTVVVRNADGTIASRNVFQNAYTDPDNYLAMLLGRTISLGGWFITLGSNVLAESPCLGPQDNLIPCLIGQDVGDLEVTVGQKSVTLRGAKVADRNGTIGLVDTLMSVCDAATAPTNCVAPVMGVAQFTRHQLAPAIPVLEGQQIQATVVLSFGAL